jgi:hypothetical protein
VGGAGVDKTSIAGFYLGLKKPENGTGSPLSIARFDNLQFNLNGDFPLEGLPFS